MPVQETKYFIELIRPLNQEIAEYLKKCERAGKPCIKYQTFDPEEVYMEFENNPILLIGTEFKNMPADFQKEALEDIIEFFLWHMPIPQDDYTRYLNRLKILSPELYHILKDCEKRGKICIKRALPNTYNIKIGIESPILHIGRIQDQKTIDSMLDFFVSSYKKFIATPMTNEERDYYMDLIKTISPALYQKFEYQKSKGEPFIERQLVPGLTIDARLIHEQQEGAAEWDIVLEVGQGLRALPVNEQRAVLAHEAAHYELGHASERVGKSAELGKLGEKLGPEGISALSNAITRTQEYEADAAAVRKTGDIDSAIAFLKRLMQEEEGTRQGIKVVTQTHPFTKDRIKHLEDMRDLIKRLKKQKEGQV